ncbi:MAG TPA: energy transducer TonB, partial [Bacteroidales bacterium]
MQTNENAAFTKTAINLDEIVFANRNHAYGAYNMRKEYKKRLLIGFIATFLIFSASIGISMYKTYTNIIVPKPEIKHDVTFAPDKLDNPLPPPPAPAPIMPTIERFTAPIIVDTTDENDLTLISMDEATALTTNDTEDLTYVPENTVNTYTPEIDEPEIGRWDVTEQATFEGGDLKTFHAWLQMNVTYPQEAIEARLSGRITLFFSVNTKGQVCDVKVIKGIHPVL